MFFIVSCLVLPSGITINDYPFSTPRLTPSLLFNF